MYKRQDLYTDENPKGTIHGLGFKDVATAKASVSKIRNSSRSHAHKIQAAVAMEQRAREMGKTSEAAVYRKFINSMKKKTKQMNEAVSMKDVKKLRKAAALDLSNNPKDIEMSINNIPGVLENGLFVDITDKVLVGKIENNIPIVHSPSKAS